MCTEIQNGKAKTEILDHFDVLEFCTSYFEFGIQMSLTRVIIPLDEIS